MEHHFAFHMDILKDSAIAQEHHWDIWLICVLRGQIMVSGTDREQARAMENGEVCIAGPEVPVRIDCCGESLGAVLHYHVPGSHQYYGLDRLYRPKAAAYTRAFDELSNALHNYLEVNFLDVEHASQKQRGEEAYVRAEAKRRMIEAMEACIQYGRAKLWDHGRESDGKKMMDYVWANFRDPLKLRQVARFMNMSDASCSRFFKKTTGYYFEKYLKKLRISQAMADICCGSRKITQIALGVGFSSVPGFNRAFLEFYGAAPGLYRKEWQMRAPENVSLKAGTTSEISIEVLRQYLLEKKVGEQKKIDITVLAGQGRAWKKSVNRAVNMGDFWELRDDKLKKQLIQQKQRLGFEYVRMYNLFGEHTELRNGHDCENLNFDGIDGIMDFLVAQGLKPLIEINEKPKIISKTIQTIFVYERKKPAFLSVEEKLEVLERFIRHMERRYGHENVEQWIFEYWYDYDINSKNIRADTYILEFCKVSSLIHRLLPAARLGGGGFGLNDVLFTYFFQGFAQKKCIPDFISIYFYPYGHVNESGELELFQTIDDEWTGEPSRVKQWMNEDGWILDCVVSARHFNRKIDDLTALMERYFGRRLPVFVTEWNSSLSSRNYFNDSCQKAGAAVNFLMEVSDHVDLLTWFLGSDLSMRCLDNRQMFAGIHGLVNKDGIPKPVFYGFEFFNRLGAFRLARGEGYCVTEDGRGNYQVLYSGICKKPGPVTVIDDESALDAENISALFQKNGREFCLSISGLEAGTYIICKYSVNGKYNNVLAEWNKIQSLDMIHQEEIDYLTNICIPRMEAWTMEVRKGRLILRLHVAGDEIVYVNIHK